MKTILIGAGGVASYFLPVFLKTFKPEHITIIDKDVLEERNLDRQMFDADQIGKNKADALLYTLTHALATPLPKYQVKAEWFTESTVIPDDTDFIVCMADNHMARHAACQAADRLAINAYIGGNEYVDSQAFVYRPEFKGTPKDPLVRYPNITTDDTGSPIRCQGEAQEAAPQLAMANFHCAAKLLHLIWVWEKFYRENRFDMDEAATNALPVELFTTLVTNEAS